MDPAGRITLAAHGSDLASGPLALAPNNMGGMPGGMLTISSNGPKDGVVWGTAPINGDANMHVVDGIIRAYDASEFDPPAAGSTISSMRRDANSTVFRRLPWWKRSPARRSFRTEGRV